MSANKPVRSAPPAGNSASRAKDTDVIVIGAGLAGLMAAVHATHAGARVRLIAQGWGQQIVTPGWISVCDRAEDDVIAEVRGYAALHPEHPYGRAGDDAMVAGLESFRAAAAAVGLPYDQRKKDGHNMRLITMLGAIQRAMIAPRGIAAGDTTEAKGPLLIVGFAGWRDFYAELTAANLRRQGIEARAIEVQLPDPVRWWTSWPGDLAREFDSARSARGSRGSRAASPNAERDRVPAVWAWPVPAQLTTERKSDGPSSRSRPPLQHGGRALSDRLRAGLRQGAASRSAPARAAWSRAGAASATSRVAGASDPVPRPMLHPATGGPVQRRIQTTKSGRVWEPLFDLPVAAPEVESRAGWYHDDLLIERGHPIHRQTGLRVNTQLQPLDAAGDPALENVYATGQLLAGFNPLTDGCAEGIALATAYKAVHTALELDA